MPIENTLWVYDGGFSTAEIEAGRAAALATLTTAGFTARQADEAAKARAEGLPHDAVAADAWGAAESAAIEAAAGWAPGPESTMPCACPTRACAGGRRPAAAGASRMIRIANNDSGNAGAWWLLAPPAAERTMLPDKRTTIESSMRAAGCVLDLSRGVRT